MSDMKCFLKSQRSKLQICGWCPTEEQGRRKSLHSWGVNVMGPLGRDVCVIERDSVCVCVPAPTSNMYRTRNVLSLNNKGRPIKSLESPTCHTHTLSPKQTQRPVSSTAANRHHDYGNTVATLTHSNQSGT